MILTNNHEMLYEFEEKIFNCMW